MLLSGCFSRNANPPEFLSRLSFETHAMRITFNEAGGFRHDFKTFWEIETVGFSKENVSYKFQKDIGYNGTR